MQSVADILIPSPRVVWRAWVARAVLSPLWSWGASLAQVVSDVEAEESDEELVARCLAGGSAAPVAFRVLVERHQSWMLRLLLSLLGGSQADAEDVAQEAFVRAYLALETWQGRGSFRGWLRVIATRTAFNWRRDRQTAHAYDDLAATDPSTRRDVVVAAAPERRALARETLEMVLGRLAYPYREILVLRYVEELELIEIAEVLDIGQSAAKMRLKRARDEFRAVAERV